MTLNTTETTSYTHYTNTPAETRNGRQGMDQRLPLSEVPKLFWAGLILFAANLIILFCISITPELNVSMYGEVPESVYQTYKPSPFTERVELAAARKPKPAIKVRPVLYQEPAVQDTYFAQLDVPRATQTLALPRVTATPAAMQDPDIRRATPTSLTVYEPETFPLRRATQPAVLHTDTLPNTVDVTPRRISQREQPALVIN